MDFMNILRQQWFYRSPNPLTLAVWFAMTLYGMHQLTFNKIQFKRFQLLMTCTSAILTVGLIVFIQDLCWLIIDAIRWVPVYPQFATLDFWLCFPRDITGIVLCFLLTADIYGTYSFNIKTGFSLLVYCMVTVLIMVAAPSLEYAIWTYAIEQNAADNVVLFGFLTNFLVGKPITIWCYTTIWSKHHAK